MKYFNLFLLAVALLISTPLLTSCSDSNSEDAPSEKTLNFYVMLSYSETDFELYDDKDIISELQALTSQTLAQTLGGKTTVVVAESEVSTVLNNVKLAFDKLVAETNAKYAYPGLYTFTVKCNEKEVTQATFYTNNLWALTKVHNTISYTPQDENEELQETVPLTTEKSPSAAYNIITTLELSRPKDYSFSYTGDETLVQEISDVYGKLVDSFSHDLRATMVTINKAKSIKKNFNGISILHGGEYSVSVHCDYLEYNEKCANLFITEDPGIDITSKFVNNTNSLKLFLTTGYPFNVDEYTKDIVLKATIFKEGDEGKDEVVAETPLTVKLVDDPSRTRVAGYKTIDLYETAALSPGNYKIRIASDWKPGNKEIEFFVSPTNEE